MKVWFLELVGSWKTRGNQIDKILR